MRDANVELTNATDEEAGPSIVLYSQPLIFAQLQDGEYYLHVAEARTEAYGFAPGFLGAIRQVVETTTRIWQSLPRVASVLAQEAAAWAAESPGGVSAGVQILPMSGIELAESHRAASKLVVVFHQDDNLSE